MKLYDVIDLVVLGALRGMETLLGVVSTALVTGLVSLRSVLQQTRVFASRMAVVMIAIVVFDDTPPDIQAAELNTPLYIKANTFSYKGENGWNSLPTLALSGEIELVSANQSRAASLFAEYHASNDSSVHEAIFAGVLIGYQGHRWDTTGYLFASRFPDSVTRATFKARLRRVLGEGRKAGLEYTAYVESPDSGELKFGYYQDLNSSLSLKLLAGAVLDGSPQPMAQLELSWQLR